MTSKKITMSYIVITIAALSMCIGYEYLIYAIPNGAGSDSFGNGIGLLLILIQLALVLYGIHRDQKEYDLDGDIENTAQTYSACISIGISGTFIGFIMIFMEFALIDSAHPKFTKETYTNIYLAFMTSISGIVLATLYDFCMSFIRNEKKANRSASTKKAAKKN